MKTILILIQLLIANLLFSQFANYTSVYNANSEFENYSIDKSKKVLKLEGSSSVSSTGIFSYTFDINTPDGINNLKPKINLSYNSSGNDYSLGMGWSIGGISYISRVNQNYYYDGKNKQIEFNSTDPFELDGKRIQPKNGNNGKHGEEYELEEESYNSIKSYGAYNNTNDNPEFFEIIQNDGKKMTYGRYNSSILTNTNSSSILVWYLSRVEDQYGNYIDYIYDKPGSNNEVVLSSIEYGGNLVKQNNYIYKIKFNYLDKGTNLTPAINFVSGNKYERSKILDNVQLIVNYTTERTYQLYYYQDELNSYLYKINMTNSNGENLNPIIFSYDRLSKSKTNLTCPNFILKKDSNSYVFYHDYNGDAINDAIQITYDEVKVGKSTGFIEKISTGLDYPGATVFKAKALNFYKNNYQGNGSVLSDFKFMHKIDLVPVTRLFIPVFKLLVNQNFRYNQIDLNFDGINDIMMHEAYYHNDFEFCNLNYPSFISGGDYPMLSYVNSYYYEYNKVSNQIATKTLPMPVLPTLADLGYTNHWTQPSIYGKNNEPFFLHRYFPSNFFVGDFDGDGYNDYLNCLQLAIDDNTNNGNTEVSNDPCQNIVELVSMIYISFPIKNITNQWLKVSKAGMLNFRNFCLKANFIEVIDFNSNGKSDLVVKKGNELRIYEWNLITNDFDLIYTAVNTPQLTFDKLAFGDFNGEGKTDLYCYNFGQTTSTTSKVYLSTGTDFIFNTSLTLPNSQIINIPPNISPKKHISIDYVPMISDFNGDGISDIAIVADSNFHEEECETVNQIPKCKPKTREYSYSVDVYYKNQKLFIYGYNFKIGRKDKPWVYSTIDVNGDGKADFYHQKDDNKLKYVCSNFENSNRTLNGIKNSFNEYKYISYARMNDKYHNLYHFNNANNLDIKLIDFKSSIMSLVHKVTSQNLTFNDIVNSYEYSNLSYHRQGKGMLGFNEFKSIIDGGSIIKTDNYYFDNSSNYIPLLSNTLNDYLYKKHTLSHSYLINKRNGINKVIQILPSYVAKYNEIGNQKTNEVIEYSYYNQYDNLKSIYSYTSYISSSNIEERVKYNYLNFDQYVNNGSLYPNKPKYVKSEIFDPISNLRDIKITNILFDNNGKISEEKTNVGKACEVSTTYIYDDFGNKTDVYQTAGGNPQRTNKLFFDARGLNILKTINSQGQTESEISYDPVLERPIIKKDILGIITDYTYDNWGGIKKEKERNKNIYTEYNSDWSSGSNFREGLYYNEVHGQTNQKKYNFYNSKGQLTLSKKSGRNNQDLFQHFDYDYKNRELVNSKPYYSSETPIEEIKSYNSNDELSTLINEHGIYTYSYQYDDATSLVSITDPAGKIKTSIYDIQKRVIRNIDNNNNTVENVYSPSDLILTTKVNGSSYITNTYNDCGLLTSQNDKSHGLSIFTYDAWGQMISNRNARQMTETYEYDKFGKLTKKINPEGEVEYSYNTSGNGMNQLAKTFTKAKDIKDHVLEMLYYDNKSRLTSHKKQIGGVTMSIKYGYNDQNQIINKQFNSGLSLSYHYDNAGNLLDINDNNGVNIYKVNNASGLEQPLDYRLGNGITTFNTYNGSFPKSFNSTNTSNGQIILDYGVNINPSTGNVDDRSYTKSILNIGGLGSVLNNNEQFGYDNLDRLIDITHNGVTKSIFYDDIGNIDEKYDVGQYINNEKNQVRAVTNDYGTISKIYNLLNIRLMINLYL